MIAHHTSNGCNLVEGDLIASGTVSGPEELARGCLLEITQRGANPIQLPNGEKRSFLEDGDESHTHRGFCEREPVCLASVSASAAEGFCPHIKPFDSRCTGERFWPALTLHAVQFSVSSGATRTNVGEDYDGNPGRK